MACDICNIRGTTLTELKEVYQTEDVRWVCPDCQGVLNEAYAKIEVVALRAQVHWFKRVTLERFRKFHPRTD